MITAPPVVPAAALASLPTPAAAPLPALALALATVPEARGKQGLLHPLVPMLLAVVYAMLCGKHHPAAIAGWVNAHYADWLRETAGFTQPQRPCRTTFHLFLRRLDWVAFERGLAEWIAGVAAALGYDLAPETLAFDGKEARGVRRMSDPALVMVSAFTHASGLTLALRTCPEGQEQAAVRALLKELTLTGRVITADALHTQRDTAAIILEGGGDSLFTVKGNQPHLAEDVRACLAPERAAAQDRDRVTRYDRAHGRREFRTLVAVSLEEGELDWPGAAQVFCLTRSVERGRERKRRFEVVYGITRLTREQADAARLLKLNRGHWTIENRSHWVRDVVCGEDAGLAYLDNTAEALAVARTTVLNALRLHGVKNTAAQFRDNVDRPREAARFLGLPVPALVL